MKFERVPTDTCTACGDESDVIVTFRLKQEKFGFCLDCAPDKIREYQKMIEA